MHSNGRTDSIGSGVSRCAHGNRALHLSGALLLVLLSAFFGSALPVLAPGLREFLSIGTGRIALLLSIGSIGSLIGSAVVGPLVDHHGPRRILVTASAVSAVIMFILAFTGRYAVFLVASVLVVAGHSAVNLSTPLYIVRLYPQWKRKSFAMNLVTGVMPGMFFPLIVERLIASNAVPFHMVVSIPLIVVAACMVIVVLPMSMHRAAPNRSSMFGRSVLSTLKHDVLPVFRQRRAWLFIGLAVAHASADAAFYQWMPTFLTSRFDHLPVGPGLTLSLFSLAYFVSRLILVLLPDRVGRRLFLIAPGILGGTLMACSVLTESPTAAALLYPAAAFFWSFEYPALASEAFRFAGAGYGSLQSASVMVSALSGFVVINLIGIVGFSTGAAVPVFLCAAAVFVLFGLTAWISRIGR